jgi:hypothetical protein
MQCRSIPKNNRRERKGKEGGSERVRAKGREWGEGGRMNGMKELVRRRERKVVGGGTETDTAIRYSHYYGAILNYLF